MDAWDTVACGNDTTKQTTAHIALSISPSTASILHWVSKFKHIFSVHGD